MGVVGKGSDGLGGVLLEADDVGITGLGGLSLQVQMEALLLGLALLNGVLLDTVEEVFTGARVRNVLDADVDALLHVAVADPLVQKDTDGRLGHVVDNTSPAVVELVRHAVILSQRYVPLIIPIQTMKLNVKRSGRR